MPMIRVVPRGLTTCVDGYLTPLIKDYVSDFAKGFKGNLKSVFFFFFISSNGNFRYLCENEQKANVSFMMSDGGLCSIDEFCGSKAILSGPAGGE
jgi:5-oxoprolinase (ATP-hydrolysing)